MAWFSLCLPAYGQSHIATLPSSPICIPPPFLRGIWARLGRAFLMLLAFLAQA